MFDCKKCTKDSLIGLREDTDIDVNIDVNVVVNVVLFLLRINFSITVTESGARKVQSPQT